MAELILAMGCFWGVQALYDQLPGVVKTEVGYAGGTTDFPSYEQVCTDTTGHAEAVKVTYNPDIISLDELLDVFFLSHDATTLNRQGPDVGSQYRSALFYKTEAECKTMEAKKAEYQKQSSKPIVTEIVAAGPFFPAEEYHQKYLEKKSGATCSSAHKVPESFWQKRMDKERYNVMREKGTEKPGSGKYAYFDEDGIYRCGGCGQALFESDSKFDAGCGWPSFDKAIPGATKTRKDFSHFMIRDEVVCSRCGSHLGHIFKDGPTETGDRFCINSAALDFENQK